MGEHLDILKDRQIWKFRFYGFFKNLKFFEPYLMIYLIGQGLSLFQIGMLYSIREAVIYVFEVPSGVLADYWGRKKELYLCFFLYITSFVVFFIAHSVLFLSAAMVLFGLAEAARSGTHKAMIYTYLDKKGWFDEKTFVYGRTRAWSLLGSALSALIAVPLALGLPAFRWLFLLSALPYIADLALISTYPEWLDREKSEGKELAIVEKHSMFSFGLKAFRSVTKDKRLVRSLLSSSIYDGMFKVVKDYVQPVLALLMAGTLAGGDNDKTIIWLGFAYCLFHLAGSIASASIWHLRKHLSSAWIMNVSFDIMGTVSLLLAAVALWGSPGTVVSLFFVLYVMKDARRPIFVDQAGDLMDKTIRATVMSVDSQLRAVVTVFTAPAFGWLADRGGMSISFAMLGFFMLAINRLLKIKSRELVPRKTQS